MPTAELAVQDQSLVRSDEAQRFLPVMSLAVAVQRREMIIEAVKKLMEKGRDYGIIPGTKEQTLLQPGADKLCNLFGLVAQFDTVKSELDWNGDQHNGESFLFYEIRCRLFRGDFLMGEGHGSCNSWEKKYRFRKADRECPNCRKQAIIKGLEKFGGGWICFKKKDGCGSRFKDGDERIEGQKVGDVPNPDIADVANTVLKIAVKRAKVAATLNATSAHEFFTQDREDAVEEQEPPVSEEAPPQRQQEPPSPPPPPREPQVVEDEDPDIRDLFASLNDPKTGKPSRGRIVHAFDHWQRQLENEGGTESDFIRIISPHGMRAAADCMKVGIDKTRAALRDVCLTVKRWRAANTPPPAAASDEPLFAEPVDD